MSHTYTIRYHDNQDGQDHQVQSQPLDHDATVKAMNEHAEAMRGDARYSLLGTTIAPVPFDYHSQYQQPGDSIAAANVAPEPGSEPDQPPALAHDPEPPADYGADGQPERADDEQAKEP